MSVINNYLPINFLLTGNNTLLIFHKIVYVMKKSTHLCNDIIPIWRNVFLCFVKLLPYNNSNKTFRWIKLCIADLISIICEFYRFLSNRIIGKYSQNRSMLLKNMIIYVLHSMIHNIFSTMILIGCLLFLAAEI